MTKIKGISRHGGEEGGQGDVNTNIPGIAWKVKTRSLTSNVKAEGANKDLSGIKRCGQQDGRGFGWQHFQIAAEKEVSSWKPQSEWLAFALQGLVSIREPHGVFRADVGVEKE